MIPIAKPIIGKEEKELVKEVLDSGILVQGPKVKELEEKFAKLCGTEFALAVNTGTAALHSSLYAAGIKPGDEVITTPFTFVATANSIILQGAKPVFADVKEDTFNIDPDSVLEKITPKTKAIIPVDLYGQIYDYKAIKEIADEHNLLIIEDACQAVNASLGGKKAGSFGDLGAFSFYATKNIMSGEGGMITSDNPKFIELARRFRDYGQDEKVRYIYHDIGSNYRMPEIQAAIVLAQLEKLDEFTEKRIKNAKLLSEGLKGIQGIQLPIIKPDAKHVFHQYTIKVNGFKLTRDELLEHLEKEGIGARIYYPKPLHLHPAYTKLGYKEGDFPVSEKLSKQVLSLPCHPSVTEEEINKIIETIKKI